MFWACALFSRRLALILGAMLVVACLSVARAESAGTEAGGEPLGIRGSMHVAFGSRLQPEGTDTYDVDLVCANALRMKGKIVRQPRELSSFFGMEKKPQELHYHIVFSVINPANKTDEKRAGLMSGIVKVQGNGAYDLSGLQISGTLPPFAFPLSGEFGGTIKGRAAEKSGLLSQAYSRIFGGKKVTVVLSKVDPLAFTNLRLAAGPLSFYPATTVTGSLDYDYETGNWIAPGIVFASGPGSGKKDVVSGTVKWVAAEDREQSGKGRYDFNLRYNEEAFNPPDALNARSASSEDEESFFLVDDRIPTLKGVVSYKDEYGARENEEEDPVVVSSDISYALEGSKLTKEQLITFAKWWLLLVGPVNDE